MNLSRETVQDNALNCPSEYGKLKKVLVVSPQNMRITEIINETQKHFMKDNIDIDKAVHQHEQFVKILEENGAEVHHLTPRKEMNEQVFTRDIGFCIGNELIVSSMNTELRKGEVKVLLGWLEEQKIPHTHLAAHSIEGGDVLVDGKNVWVGISGRTNRLAVQALKKLLPDYTVHALPLRSDILHLDCVFTIISEEAALVYPPAFSKKDLEKIKEHYNIIEVSEKEQFRMGPNVLAIGDKTIVSLPQNGELNERIREKGFKVIETDFSEIIKSGGSFRCCTLPLVRE
ncbi:dimethylarginine dimethylaminohydrolase family protein [Rossellomorea oryzaecorticis]|uniref:Dimethylarginine dimethylaminohydrolase family protein n=1 Tax=Rossellomorea oryzaecorticis TaxID=1396505 RepID=A0ABW8VL11_9BACI